ncbi:MAG: protoporphyrinogen oxidase, partial [Ornithinibacter sp.]
MSAPAASPRPHVAVVGGGIAGLSAALEVLDRWPGVRLTLLEGSDRLGGKLRREPVAGHPVDVGAEAMLSVRPEATDLVGRLGMGEELTTPSTTSASVWSRGALRPLPRATLMGVPTDPASALGVLDDGEVARLRDERDWPGGRVAQDVSVGDYVGARLGPAVVDRLVEPLLGGVYAGHASRLSLQATMPTLWNRATRAETLLRPEVPPTTPGGDRPRTPFAGIVGGVGRLPGFLADEIRRRGATVRTGVAVRGLERVGEQWRLVLGSAAAPESLRADAVLLCVPPAPAARLLGPHAPEAARLLGEVETASTAVVTLAVTRRGLPDLPGSGFLVPPVEGRTIKASTFSGNKWAWTGSLSEEVVHLRASIGRAREERVLQRDDADLVEVSVAEISAAVGRALPPVVDSHVQRWGGGLPQYAVGHVARVAAVRAAIDGVAGLEVAGATYDGVGIPAVISSAVRAARATIAFLAMPADAGSRRHPSAGSGAEHDTTLTPATRLPSTQTTTHP